MATIMNERDKQLQATSPRLLPSPANYISISPSTNSISTTATGTLPSDVTIIAHLNGILTGTIVWTTSPVVTTTPITNGIIISGSQIPSGTSVTVTATVTYLGSVYTSSIVITHNTGSIMYWLNQTAANINKSAVGAFTPTTVTFDAKTSGGASSSPTAYLGRYIVDISTDGTNFSNLYTGGSDQSTYVYTPNAAHKAVRVKLYKSGGLITLLDEALTTISESGVVGAVGDIYYLTPSTYILTKNQNNVFVPATVTFTGFYKSGGNSPSAYAGRFKIYENGSGIASYTSGANETAVVYAPTTGCTSIKGELYLAGGTITKLDEQSVTTTGAGSNSINAILTNDSHPFPADVNGVVTSYVGSGTDLYVYEGGVQIPYNEAGYTAGTNSTWKVVTSSTNITVGAKSDSGNFATFAQCSSVASGVDTSTITFTISGRTSIGILFTITLQQSFSKSKQGLTGPEPSTANFLTTAGANVLTGTLVPSDSGGIKLGPITWDPVTGMLSPVAPGNTGIALTKWGLMGAKDGLVTFGIEGATGATTFQGAIVGGSTLDITGDIKCSGKGGFANGVLVGGTFYNVDTSITTYSSSNATNINTVRCGMYSSVNATMSLYNVGMAGVSFSGTDPALGPIVNKGIGLVGQGSLMGGYFVGLGTGVGFSAAIKAINNNTAPNNTVHICGPTYAVESWGRALFNNPGFPVSVALCNPTGSVALDIVGNMKINNANLVTNLNADYLDGRHSLDFLIVVNGNIGTATVSSSGLGMVSTIVNTRVSCASNIITLETGSDEIYKTKIKPEKYGLKFIESLTPVMYSVKEEEARVGLEKSRMHHGFIAQDMVKVLDGLELDVLYHELSDGNHGIDYLGLIAPMVKAIQELSAEVAKLKGNKNV